MTDTAAAALVEKSIKKLLEEFKENPDKFLTECDVQCYLYKLLYDDFSTLEPTIDGSKSIPLHTEIRHYGVDRDLDLTVDIAIVDTTHLETVNAPNLLTKGFAFVRTKAVIEIKLRRKIGDSNQQFKEEILADRNKIRILRDNAPEGPNGFYSYIIALDKKQDINFQTENNELHKEFYLFVQNKPN